MFRLSIRIRSLWFFKTKLIKHKQFELANNVFNIPKPMASTLYNITHSLFILFFFDLVSYFRKFSVWAHIDFKVSTKYSGRWIENFNGIGLNQIKYVRSTRDRHSSNCSPLNWIKQMCRLECHETQSLFSSNSHWTENIANNVHCQSFLIELQSILLSFNAIHF